MAQYYQSLVRAGAVEKFLVGTIIREDSSQCQKWDPKQGRSRDKMPRPSPPTLDLSVPPIISQTLPESNRQVDAVHRVSFLGHRRGKRREDNYSGGADDNRRITNKLNFPTSMPFHTFGSLKVQWPSVNLLISRPCSNITSLRKHSLFYYSHSFSSHTYSSTDNFML